jgi:hypothetical protein
MLNAAGFQIQEAEYSESGIYAAYVCSSPRPRDTVPPSPMPAPE